MSLPNPNYLGFKDPAEMLQGCPRYEKFGKVVYMVGNMIEADGLDCSLGDICRITPCRGANPIFAEVVGFHQKRLKLSPLTPLRGIYPGCLVQPYQPAGSVLVSHSLLGRVLDGLGQPIEVSGPFPTGVLIPFSATFPILSNVLSSPNSLIWASGASTACSPWARDNASVFFQAPEWGRAPCSA